MALTAKFPGTDGVSKVALADFGGEIAGIPNTLWTLNGAITDVATSVVVNEAIHATVPTVGWMTIENEALKWTSYVAGTKTFTVVRGQQDTTGAAHANGVAARITITKELLNRVMAEMISVQTEMLRGIFNPNLVLNSDFGRRTVKDTLFMPEVFADTSGVTTLVGTAPTVAANVLTAGAASAEQIYVEGLTSWKDARYSGTIKLTTDDAAAQFGVGKFADADNYVVAELVGGATDLFRIVKQIGAADTVVDSIAFVPTVNQWYWLELEAQGTTYIAKLYSTGVTTPGTTKAASTLEKTLTVTISDAGVATGRLGYRASSGVTTAMQVGGLSASPGGVFVEGWGPESWTVVFAGTLGGQAIGFDESADAGPLSFQYAMRAYIPEAGRRINVHNPQDLSSPNRRAIGSQQYAFSGYVKTSGKGGSGDLVRGSFVPWNGSGGTSAGAMDIADAGVTSWTRKTPTAQLATGANAELFYTVWFVNPGSTATGTAFFMCQQLEQGGAATAWRNAPADDAADFLLALKKVAAISVTSTADIELDSRDLAVNLFLPYDATVMFHASCSVGNTAAGNSHFLNVWVDGAIAETDDQGRADAHSVTNLSSISIAVPVRLAAGKHRIALRARVGGGTGDFRFNRLTAIASRGK